MPKREDLQKILIIGSGPIVIGQACEFDYSGNQAVRALKEEGYTVILHNPNPATIMTTPGNAHIIYFDPLEREYLIDILKKEKPNAILPTMGGQNALNLIMSFEEEELENDYNVELIGAGLKSISLAEDRGLFKNLMTSIGLHSPISALVRYEREALKIIEQVGFPLIIRPSFTLGGQGGSIAYSKNEFSEKLEKALRRSPVGTALVEESLLGYQEFEFEVMRDKEDNALVVCAIENIDPMGIHTGDSITVAPTQTLSDSEYQVLRTASIDVLRAVGVECGGSNVQFAYNQKNKRLLVIEMNPRVSRSSALASKVTGFPIARSAAKLAVGYNLHEIINEITKNSTSFFEPALDYCAVKIPRFELRKFPIHELNTQMRSIGESLSFGTNFCEALNKAIRAIEIGYNGLEEEDISDEELQKRLQTFHPKRIFAIYTKILRDGEECIQNLSDITGYHSWVLYQLLTIANREKKLKYLSKEIQSNNISQESIDEIYKAKCIGFVNEKIATLLEINLHQVEEILKKHSIKKVYRCVDTCAAEFKASTPYYYGSYIGNTEHSLDNTESVVILGSGPNRIGQGLEFDACCTLAAFAFQKRGYSVTIINSNPETVSTDYNVSNSLFFEPLSDEDVYDVLQEKNTQNLVVQLGGQTPITVLKKLQSKGIVPIGTSVDSIDIVENRRRFLDLLHELQKEINIYAIPGAIVHDIKEVGKVAENIGFPVLIRPSYVLGGQSMVVVYSQEELQQYISDNGMYLQDNDLLVDKFLENAIEYDVDIVSDSESIYIAGILQHVEHAGVHSGDSACVFEPKVLQSNIAHKIYKASIEIVKKLSIKGLLNIQFASVGDNVYVLEANPRSSRTVPFISKTSGVDIIDMAVAVWTGEKLGEQATFKERILKGYEHLAVGYSVEGYAVKESVFSFDRFDNIDPALGPEMRSTGEAIGLGDSFGEAFAKASMVASTHLPRTGTICMSIAGKYQHSILKQVRQCTDLGFDIIATPGTAKVFHENNIPCEIISRVFEAKRNELTIIDEIQKGNIDIIINILKSVDAHSFLDDKDIRNAALRYRVPYISTIPALNAAIEGIAFLKQNKATARKLTYNNHNV